jgi:hypothetical protein
MKQSVQDLITLIVLKLNALKTYIDAVKQFTLDTFVKKTDDVDAHTLNGKSAADIQAGTIISADTKYIAIGTAIDAVTVNGKSAAAIQTGTIAIADTKYIAIGTALDAATLNGKTAAVIESDAALAAASLVNQLKDAFHQGIRNFVVVPFSNGDTLNFGTLLTNTFGNLSAADADGSYAVSFLNGHEGHATLTNVHASANLPSDTGTVENKDILYVTVAGGVITKVTLYSDPDTDILLALQASVSALQASLTTNGTGLATLQTTVANIVNQLSTLVGQEFATQGDLNSTKTNLTNLQALVQTIIDSYISTNDFAGMKAYVLANIAF